MERHTPKSEVDVVLVALATPILVGVYQKGELIATIESQQKTSEALPLIFKDLFERYTIRSVYFARGPGSFMSIKLVYIFLRTLQIAQGITLKACDAFAFNAGAPIKATGNLFFVKENGKIVTKIVRDAKTQEFRLPARLAELSCEDEVSPLYILPAVKA